MKNILRFFALAATVAVAAISCSKEVDNSKPQGPVNFVIRANAPTKTAINDNGDGSYTPTWNANDAIGVFFTTVSGAPAEFDNSEQDGDIAIFAPKNTISVSGDQTLFGFYPYGAFQAVSTSSANDIRVNVKDIQTPDAVGTFDKDADILLAKPYDGNVETIVNDGGIIDLQFARLLSVLKITPTYSAAVAEALAGEYIKSVKVEFDGAGEDAPLTGRVTLNLETGELGNWTIKSYSVVAEYEDNAFAVESGNSAYLIVNPTTIAAEKTITFTIKTDKHDISKAVYLDSDVAFPAGNIAKIGLAVDDTWTIESNTISQDVIFMAPFTAEISSNTTYDASTHGSLGVIGTSSETITYTFAGTYQLRNNGNKISAEDGSFYWCTSSTGLVIGGINTGTAQYFKLSFDRKVTSGTATLALSISQDGSHYFPVTATETVSLTGTAVANESYYFSLPEGEHTNLSLKFANSGSGAVIDNVTLTKLTSAGEGNTEVSLQVEAVEPTLVVSPNPVNMLVDGTQQLTVTGTDGEVSYESTNTDVATVSETGLITAKAAGSATINITTAATTDYKAGSTSVEVTVTSEVIPESLPYENTLINGHDGFTINNVSTGSLTAVWTDTGYGVQANGYQTTSDIETYLESPLIDLTNVQGATLAFTHGVNYFASVDKAKEETALEVRIQDGDWVAVEIPNYPSSLGNGTVDTEVILNSFTGNVIQFRFKFIATSTKPGRWQIKNLSVTESDPRDVVTLAFEKSSYSLTVGTEDYEGFTPQTATATSGGNSANIAIAYAISDENGVTNGFNTTTGSFTLTGTVGTATITASFEGDQTYQPATSVSYTVTVKEATTGGNKVKKYVKVTSGTIGGEYLIVRESSKYVFDGSLDSPDSATNYQTASDLSSLDYDDWKAYAVTIESYSTGYSIQTASGKYIGRNANSNGIDASTTLGANYVNSISFASNGTIEILGKGGRKFNFNSSSNRFRYFASGNTTEIYLYELQEVDE